MINSPFLRTEVDFVCNLFTTVYSRSFSEIPPHSINSINADYSINTLVSYADLGDYLPFLSLAEVDANYIHSQLLASRDLFRQSPRIDGSIQYPLRPLVNHHSPIEKFIRRIFNTSLAFSYSDFLFGTILLYDQSKCTDYLDLSLEIASYVLSTFSAEHQGISYCEPSSKAGPFTIDSNNDFFSELMCELYRQSADPKYLDYATQILEPSLKTDIYTDYGWVPCITQTSNRLDSIIYSRMRRKYVLAKNNVAFANSLIQLYATTSRSEYRDHFYKWFSSQQELRHRCGYTPFSFNLGEEAQASQNLKNYALIDTLHYAYIVFKDPLLLDFALNVYDETYTWLDKETGVLPEQPNGAISFFDSNTDFSVSMLKLYSITKDPSLLSRAASLIQSTATLHRSHLGYLSRVHLNGSLSHPHISTRYTALFLKALLSLRLLEQDDFDGFMQLIPFLRDR